MVHTRDRGIGFNGKAAGSLNSFSCELKVERWIIGILLAGCVQGAVNFH